MALLSQKDHQIYCDPSFESLDQALSHASVLAVGAHPDDLEVMAGHGILSARDKKAFVGVTCTNGGGSPREGSFKNLSDQEMIITRRQEQVESAKKGQYASALQLNYASGDIKSHYSRDCLSDLKNIIQAIQPQVVYTHNPLDKHQTHVGVTAHLVEALRELNYQPQQFYGCEVWRGLDWVDDKSKILLPIEDAHFIAELISCHRSQTEGGKDYAAATLGRMKANSTYHDANEVDQSEGAVAAISLLPLLSNPGLSLNEFAQGFVDRLQSHLKGHLTPFSLGGNQWK